MIEFVEIGKMDINRKYDNGMIGVLVYVDYCVDVCGVMMGLL